MAQVAAVVRIFPQDAERVEELRQRVESELRPSRIEIEDIGFGVKALRITLILSDETGGDVEERVRRIPGVSEVSVESVGRL
ncbi:MAG: effector protein [Candidatus Micrarchaeia archaeon]